MLTSLTAVDCGSLVNPIHGQVDTFSGTSFTSVATYTCNAGYNLIGSGSRDCTANGVWSQDAPICQSIFI